MILKKRIQSYIDKVKNNPYFNDAMKMQNINSQEFSSRYYFGVGEQSRQYYIYKNLLKWIPSFEFEGAVNVGFYEFTYKAYIGMPKYLYDRGFKSYIWINANRYPKDYYNTDWQRIELNGSEKDLDKVVREHLLKYFHPQGCLAYYQWWRNCTLKDAYSYTKMAIQGKVNFTFGELDEDKIRRIFEKRFNVKSYISIKDTVKAINGHGRYEQLTTFYGFDCSFMETFDGDIDDIFEAIEENNPSEANVIYF